MRSLEEIRWTGIFVMWEALSLRLTRLFFER